MIGIEEAASLSIEAHLCPAMLNLSFEPLFVELVRHLVEQGLLALLHVMILEHFERLFE